MIDDIASKRINTDRVSIISRVIQRRFEDAKQGEMIAVWRQFHSLYYFHKYRLWEHMGYDNAAQAAVDLFHCSKSLYYNGVRAYYELAVICKFPISALANIRNKTSIYDIANYVCAMRKQGNEVDRETILDWIHSGLSVEALRREILGQDEPDIKEVAEKAMMDVVTKYGSILADDWVIEKKSISDDVICPYCGYRFQKDLAGFLA